MLLACYSHQHISYRIRTIIRKAIIDERRFEDTNLTESDEYYKHGVVKFFGSIAFEGVVKEYKNKVVTLFTSPPYQIFAGDIALFTIIRTDRNMLLACYSHKHISYRIRTIIRKAINIQYSQVAIKHFQLAEASLTIL